MGRLPAALGPVNEDLYDRLGGAAAVVAVVDDALDRHAANPTLAQCFRDKDLPQLKALGVSVFIPRVTAPHSTQAAGPALADAGMCFSQAELQAVAGDLTETLREQGIAMVEAEEIVKLLYAAREAPPH